MDKRQRLNSVDSNADLDDMDDRPSSSMSFGKDDEKVDIEGPATPFPRQVQPSPQFIMPPTPSVVKSEIEDPLVTCSTSQHDTNKIPSVPINTTPLNNVPILPHEAHLPPQPHCLNQYNNPLAAGSLPYPYLYYSQLYASPLYLGRPPQLPQLPPSSLERASRDFFSHPYFRSPQGHHPSSMLGVPSRPIPLHYLPPQVQANL